MSRLRRSKVIPAVLLTMTTMVTAVYSRQSNNDRDRQIHTGRVVPAWLCSLVLIESEIDLLKLGSHIDTFTGAVSYPH